jgi:aminomuconate-semialdehyde/2-hydroxymuconate-6-semialdehyde dehydrogenase
MLKISHYINGQLVEPLSGQFLDNIEPATGKVYSLVPDGDARDVERAIDAAERALPAWSKTPAGERCRVMLKIADMGGEA